MKRSRTGNVDKTDSVVLSLTLTAAAEARLLRDEIYIEMGELSPPEWAGMFQDGNGEDWVPDDEAFGDWLDTKRQAVYTDAVFPVCEKLYVALRVALRQSAEVPTLGGRYTRRDKPMLKENWVELYEQFLKLKFKRFREMLCEHGSAREGAAGRFSKSEGIKVVVTGNKPHYFMPNDQEESGEMEVTEEQAIKSLVYAFGKVKQSEATLPRNKYKCI